MPKQITKNILKDFGAFGDKEASKVKHLTLTEWGDYKAKYDLRPWDNDMDKCGKGISLTKAEIIELKELLNSINFEED